MVEKLRNNNHLLNLFALILVSLLHVSCGSEINVNLYDLKTIFAESKNDGSGIIVRSKEVILGDDFELYSIKRDDGRFIDNISTSWSLSGDIGTLTISPDGKSAKFLASATGSGQIQILEEERIVYTVNLITKEVDNNVKSVLVNSVTSNGFNIVVETEQNLISSDSGIFYYCNYTKILNCNPKNWYSLPMLKSGKNFTVSSPLFKFPDDPKDEINILVSVNLNTGLDERSFIVQLDGPQQIYRSIGVGSIAAIETRTSSGINEANITNSVIVFDSNISNNIGIGDSIVIDHNVAVGFEDVFFIRKRIAANQFLLNDIDGNRLTSDILSISDWEIYRSYTSLSDSNNLSENVGIPVEVRDFDTSRNAVSDNKAWHFAFYADAVSSHTNTAVVLQNWNLGADNFLRYYTPFLDSEVGISQRHQGYFDVSKGTLSLGATGDYQWGFIQRLVGRNAFRLEGFQFLIDGNGFISAAFRGDSYQLSADSYVYFHNNLISSNNSTGNGFSLVKSAGSGYKGYVFSNIAFNLGGIGFEASGDDTIFSHNTSYNNGWNYFGNGITGIMTAIGNISLGGTTYEFRGAYSTSSDFNIAGPASSSDPPGLNSFFNSTLGDVSFINTTPGSENLCTDNLSIAYILGPKMINESDPYKIYYDAAGNVRNPNDFIFPLGACFQ